jgi:hypothetical protein
MGLREIRLIKNIEKGEQKLKHVHNVCMKLIKIFLIKRNYFMREWVVNIELES